MYIFYEKYEINQIFYFGKQGHFGQKVGETLRILYIFPAVETCHWNSSQNPPTNNRKNKISQIYSDMFKMMMCFEANS